MEEINETLVNIISEDTRIEGKICFAHVTRFHGTLVGDIEAKPDSEIILGETAVVEGNIQAETLVIDGYVRGDVHAKTKVVISATGRVIGNVQAPSVEIQFGAYFEGQCAMQDIQEGTRPPSSPTLNPSVI